MSCRWTDAIVAGLTGPDAPGIDDEARRHLDHCARCQAAVRRADGLDTELGVELRHMRTDELPRSVLAAPAPEPARAGWHRPGVLIAGTATVAVAALLAGIALAPPRPVSNLPFGASGPQASGEASASAGQPSGTPAPSAPPTAAPAGDPLRAGEIAAVVDEPLVVRTSPGTADAATITTDRLWKGQRVRLLEGPVEADGYPWWRVRIGEIEGWVATEEKDGSKPWISPLGNGDILYAAPDLELRLVAPDGADDRPFLTKPLSELRPAISCGSTVTGTWSADGTFAIVVDAPACDGSIYRVDADGRTGTHLADGLEPALSGDGGQMAFTPQVTFSCATACPVPGLPDAADIQVVPSDGSSGPQAVGDSDQGLIPSHPTWAPDRRSVAYAGYAHDDAGGSNPGVYVTDESETRRVTDGFAPTWSPDGRWIVFGRPTPSGLDELLRIHPDGSAEQALGLGDPDSVAFSPDGELLAVTGAVAAEHHFLSVTAFGQPIESGRLVDEAYDVTWSPDGERLAWSAWDGSQMAIWVANADGTDARAIVPGQAPAWRPLIGG